MTGRPLLDYGARRESHSPWSGLRGQHHLPWSSRQQPTDLAAPLQIDCQRWRGLLIGRPRWRRRPLRMPCGPQTLSSLKRPRRCLGTQGQRFAHGARVCGPVARILRQTAHDDCFEIRRDSLVTPCGRRRWLCMQMGIVKLIDWGQSCSPIAYVLPGPRRGDSVATGRGCRARRRPRPQLAIGTAGGR